MREIEAEALPAEGSSEPRFVLFAVRETKLLRPNIEVPRQCCAQRAAQWRSDHARAQNENVRRGFFRRRVDKRRGDPASTHRPRDAFARGEFRYPGALGEIVGTPIQQS